MTQHQDSCSKSAQGNRHSIQAGAADPRQPLFTRPQGMRMSLTITPTTLTDIPVLCHLLDRLFTQDVEFQPDRAAQERGLASIIRNPQVGHILVAQQEGQIVGMVNLLYTVSTALGGRVALLEDMVVAPETRGQGVGAQLLAQAIALAKANGCLRITLLTDAVNEAAQRFYQRQGFVVSPMMPLRLMLATNTTR